MAVDIITYSLQTVSFPVLSVQSGFDFFLMICTQKWCVCVLFWQFWTRFPYVIVVYCYNQVLTQYTHITHLGKVHWLSFFFFACKTEKLAEPLTCNLAVLQFTGKKGKLNCVKIVWEKNFWVLDSEHHVAECAHLGIFCLMFNHIHWHCQR